MDVVLGAGTALGAITTAFVLWRWEVTRRELDGTKVLLEASNDRLASQGARVVALEKDSAMLRGDLELAQHEKVNIATPAQLVAIATELYARSAGTREGNGVFLPPWATANPAPGLSSNDVP